MVKTPDVIDGLVRDGLVRVLLVSVSVELIVGTSTPSTVILPAAPLAKVVSEACPSSMVPTPIGEVVEAVIPATGRPVQFVRVPDAGVPNAGAVRVGLVSVLFVKVCVSLVVTSVFVLGIVVPLIVEEAVMAPVTAKVPPTEVLPESVEAPVTPRVPPIVALPVTGKLEAVPALITLERVTFFKAVAEASYIRSRSLA